MDHVRPRTFASWHERLGAILRGRLAAGGQAPYCRIGDFLSARGADQLLSGMIERRDEFRARGVNSSGDATFYRMKAPMDPGPEFLRRFDDLVPMLQDRFGTDLGEPQIELNGQAYNDGCFFRKHSDADAGGPNWQRRLSGVYYVHTQPRRFEGGGLVLYDRRGHAHLVEPGHNSAVFFARDALHEVLPVSCASRAFEDSRFAVNIWIS